jgi:flagellar hook-associated protein 3 FlgL
VFPNVSITGIKIAFICNNNCFKQKRIFGDIHKETEMSMRIGTHTLSTSIIQNQHGFQNKLTRISGQLSSGNKIQFSNQASGVFSNALRLRYDETLATQSIEIANKAKLFSDTTDNVLNQFKKQIEQLKNKLIAASNQTNSEANFLALANEMKTIRNHLVTLSNTSMGGRYLFAGSRVDTPPITHDGRYQGNNEEMKALTGPNTFQTYNMNGQDLFLGTNSDVKQQITTNIKHFNQEHLHPEIMSATQRDKNPEERYIIASDTLRSLVGDNDDNPSTYGKDNKEYFYVRGRKPDGTYFQSKFDFQVGYSNKDTATKIQDLLDRIGISFGNSTLSQVVDVTLNNWGQIEIHDLNSGSSLLDFHMISSTDNVEDIDDLLNQGTPDTQITEYVKGNFYSLKTVSKITAQNDPYDHRLHRFMSTLKRDDNSLVRKTDSLHSIFGSDASQISLTGTNSAGNVVTSNMVLSGNTVHDLMNQLAQDFSANSGDVEVHLANGQIYMTDTTVKNVDGLSEEPYNGKSLLSASLETQDPTGSPIAAISNDYSVEYDRVRFEKNGSKLLSNISQYITHDNTYATHTTKLREVAGPIDDTNITLDGETYTIDMKDISGTRFRIHLDFQSTGSTYSLQDLDNNVNYGPMKILDPYDSTLATAADDVTYQQLTDIITTAMNFSNLVASGSQQKNLTELTALGIPDGDLNADGNIDSDDVAESYKNALNLSYRNVKVSLDHRARLNIQDLNNGQTQADFSLYSEKNQYFSHNSNFHTDKGLLTFHATNALTIDEPHIDLFEQIETAIVAVENGILRPDGNNSDVDFDHYTRNIGIQNSMKVIEHLLQHVIKQTSKNGAQGNAFQFSIEKYEVQKVQIRSLHTDTIGTDAAEASMKLSQLNFNYQAMLYSTAKIQNLSLINYL